MRGAMVILIAMVVIGVILYIADVVYYRKKYPPTPASTDSEKEKENAGNDVTADNSEGCCGLHLVCEKTGLSPVSNEIVYYDDEELDRFKGRSVESYTPEEVEEFREILLTLLPEDVAGWSRSIQLREINLPIEIRDELLMIVDEIRRNEA